MKEEFWRAEGFFFVLFECLHTSDLQSCGKMTTHNQAMNKDDGRRIYSLTIWSFDGGAINQGKSGLPTIEVRTAAIVLCVIRHNLCT